jgi:histidine triad (HIT) family protein
MDDCIFCKIAAGEIPSEFLYQDDDMIAFRDINPLAPVHILVVTKKHIPSLIELSDADLPLVAGMVKVANQLAESEGIAGRGYRLVVNCGKEGGQVVQHLHLHLLGGRQLSGGLG